LDELKVFHVKIMCSLFISFHKVVAICCAAKQSVRIGAAADCEKLAKIVKKHNSPPSCVFYTHKLNNWYQSRFSCNRFTSREILKMSPPQGMLEGQSITGPSYFNGQHYGWWKNRMENYMQAEDYELWILIKNGPLIPVKVNEEGKAIKNKPKEFDSTNYKMMEKNAKAKKLLYFGLGQDE